MKHFTISVEFSLLEHHINQGLIPSVNVFY